MNCISLCTFHHRMVHEGGWRVSGDGDDRLVFTSPHGKRFTDVCIGRRAGALPFVAGIDERTIATALGERLDLHHAVAVLQHPVRPSRN